MGISLPLFSWEIECCSLFSMFFPKGFFVYGALKVGSQTLGYLFLLACFQVFVLFSPLFNKDKSCENTRLSVSQCISLFFCRSRMSK